MKVSILGTNGFLSTAIARYCNARGWCLDMYGLSEPESVRYSHFLMVNLMDSEADIEHLQDSDRCIDLWSPIGIRNTRPGMYIVSVLRKFQCL